MLHATSVKFQYEENSFCFNSPPKNLDFFSDFHTEFIYNSLFRSAVTRRKEIEWGGKKSKSACLFYPESQRKGSTVLDPCNRGKQESERCVCSVVTGIKQSLPDV